MDLDKLKNKVNKLSEEDEKTKSEYAVKQATFIDRVRKYNKKLKVISDEEIEAKENKFVKDIRGISEEQLQEVIEEFFANNLRYKDNDNIVIGFHIDMHVITTAQLNIDRDAEKYTEWYTSYKQYAENSNDSILGFIDFVYEWCEKQNVYARVLTFIMEKTLNFSLSYNSNFLINNEDTYKTYDSIRYVYDNNLENEDDIKLAEHIIYYLKHDKLTDNDMHYLSIKSCKCSKDMTYTRVIEELYKPVSEALMARLEEFGLKPISSEYEGNNRIIYIKCKNPLVG